MQKKLNSTLREYYAKRALEYEAVYHRNIPTRLKEQSIITRHIKKIFKQKYVLELACGTGYWTNYLAESAEQVLATDINREMLEIASQKIRNSSVQFLIADAYNPPVSIPPFSGGMANFWFSHIPRKQIAKFLTSFHTVLEKKSPVVIADGIYRKELGGDLVRKDKSGDSYKRRILENKKEFSILKNYYSEKELVALFAPYSENLSITYLSHFWIVTYWLKPRYAKTRSFAAAGTKV